MVVKDFHDALARSPDTAVAVAAIKVSSTSLNAVSCFFALLRRRTMQVHIFLNQVWQTGLFACCS